MAVQIQALPLSSCVMLGKSLSFPVPHTWEMGRKPPVCESLRMKYDQRWEMAQPCKALRRCWLSKGPPSGQCRELTQLLDHPSLAGGHTRQSQLLPSWSRNTQKAPPSSQRTEAGHKTPFPAQGLRQRIHRE